MSDMHNTALPCSDLNCGRCQRKFGFPMTSKYIDLTVGSGMNKTAYKEVSWAGAELFKCVSISNMPRHRCSQMHRT